MGADEEERPGKCWREGDEVGGYDGGARAYGDWASGPEEGVPEFELAYEYAESCDPPDVGHGLDMWLE